MFLRLVLKSTSLFVCILMAACSRPATESNTEERRQAETAAIDSISEPDEPDNGAQTVGDSVLGKEPGEARNDNGLKMKLVWCPPGEFTMGSPAGEKERNVREDQVKVRLTEGFWLGKYEVTQDQYKQVMGNNPSCFSPIGEHSSKVQGLQTARFPVDNVSWDEAAEFCRRFTEQERAAGRLPAGWEYSLPTEAQWEYACRAETTTPYSFGTSWIGTQANCNGNLYGMTHKGKQLERTAAVGSFAKNRWGLYDMHGNVWEWSLDAYDEKLPGGSDPFVSEGPARVTRGGGWCNDDAFCRSASRHGVAPDSRSDSFGFRLARCSIR